MTAHAPGVIVFDLDDTLYLERDYAFSGFHALGRWIGKVHGIQGFADAAMTLFNSGRRGDIFNESLRQLSLDPDPRLISDLVARYRRHRPRISLAPDAARFVAALPERWRLALITDGPTASQSRKISALGLRSLGFNPIFMTDRWGISYRKPHPRAFQTVARHLGAEAERCLYVADNSMKDFVAPRRLGWRSVQIVRDGGIHQAPPPSTDHAADLVIRSLDELDWRWIMDKGRIAA